MRLTDAEIQRLLELPKTITNPTACTTDADALRLAMAIWNLIEWMGR